MTNNGTVAVVEAAVEAAFSGDAVAFRSTFARLTEMLDRMAREERAYWASPAGQAVAAARREADRAARAARAAALSAKLEALRVEVSDLLAERDTLRAAFAALPRADRAARAEMSAEINEVSALIGKANAKLLALEKAGV